MIGFNYLGKLGQLGNQMFQYAAVVGAANNIGTSFCVPKHDEVVTDVLGNKLRIELYDAFDIEPERVGYVPTNNNYQEKDFPFEDEVLSLEGDWNLIGYFQTEKYFSHVSDRIRKDFTFHEWIRKDCDPILEQFDNPVCLHIRRGDYIINSDNHHNLSLKYYEKALKYFDSDRQVVIFSDDPGWCLEQKLFSDDRFIVAEDIGPYHSLYLMTKCSDFIIANSTYSWWGAWLANRGKVIAPNTWFGPNNAHKSIKDLYPEHWTTLNYS